MTFRQALAKHRFIAALLLIGMAIYFFLLVMHIHAILTLNAPLSFTSFYLVFYLCFCCYIIVRMLQDKIMIYWFLASLFLFCFPCTSPLFEYKEDGPKVLADMPACIKNMKIIYEACISYADDHNGNYPDTLSRLLHGRKQYLDPENLECPGNWMKATPPIPGYLYYGAGLIKNKEPRNYLFLEDKPGNHMRKKYCSKMIINTDNNFYIIVPAVECRAYDDFY